MSRSIDRGSSGVAPLLRPGVVVAAVTLLFACGSGGGDAPGPAQGGAGGSSAAAGPDASVGRDSGRAQSDASIAAATDGATSPNGDGSTPPSGDGATSPGDDAQTSGDAGATASDRVRTIVPLDTGWLFHYGDASGASGATYADGSWESVTVPHDWSIEGPNPPSDPFAADAATTGRGAYLPSGIGWYRRHFTLPEPLSGDRIYVEFDGVMANSDVYVNGAHLGHHPYGYVSFRYDVTAAVQFGGADNVLAVKTDTTLQPAERFYTGAGIYRHARLLATNAVHVDQYATVVTTPAPTVASAAVHVKTSIVNSGTGPASVVVRGTLSAPDGSALPPLTSAPQTVAAGASAPFALDFTVASPKLWDLGAPNLYRLVLDVVVSGAPVDDDVVDFGIRELLFNQGMTLNGKSIKFQGVANHQDYHGLGMAAPQRAMQRRLARLKALGVNAVRTAHDPPSPDFLDLTDRMGILVLDEFADVWTAHKYADVGDYAAYFGQIATAPTGMPAVPTVSGVTSASATWWQVDLTGWIMRDRNHPSVALYSMGNEIHDSLAIRTPILTKMIALSHALDPSRSVTQALLDPSTAGDVGGATNTLLDVWGDNYDVASCLTAMKTAPTKSGLLTEMGTETSTWATVTANAGLTGEFMWTGVDYLGEADGQWPTIGSAPGIMDELGEAKALGLSWQKVWGLPATPPPATGVTAARLVLAADHASIVTDVDDVAFVKAAIADSAGRTVPAANAAVTFGVTGPGAIIAVDSASQRHETFRGSVRNTYDGVAYAIVRATSPGTITVTASAPGLGQAQTSVQASAGTFVPCTGTCD